MENPNNQNQRVTFSLPGDITIIDVISDILKNNGLEETSDEFCKKLGRKETPRLIIIKNTAQDLAINKLSEKDLVTSLQNQLKTQKETAEKLLKDIKEKLIPFAKKIVAEEKITTTENLLLAETDLPEVKPLSSNINQPIKEEVFREKQKKTKIYRKNENINSPPVKNEKPYKKDDAYREPIE